MSWENILKNERAKRNTFVAKLEESFEKMGSKLAPQDRKGFMNLIKDMENNISSDKFIELYKKLLDARAKFNSDIDRVKQFGYIVDFGGGHFHLDSSYYSRMGM
jgi:hypothetical protein